MCKKNVYCLHHNILIELNINRNLRRISFINFAVNVSRNTNIEVKIRKWMENDTILHLATLCFIVYYYYFFFSFFLPSCVPSFLHFPNFIYTILELLIKLAPLNWAWQLKWLSIFDNKKITRLLMAIEGHIQTNTHTHTTNTSRKILLIVTIHRVAFVCIMMCIVVWFFFSILFALVVLHFLIYSNCILANIRSINLFGSLCVLCRLYHCSAQN